LFAYWSHDQLVELYTREVTKKCVNQEAAEEVLELGDITAVVVGADAVCFSDVSYPQKRNRKGWRTTETN